MERGERKKKFREKIQLLTHHTHTRQKKKIHYPNQNVSDEMKRRKKNLNAVYNTYEVNNA